MAFHTAILLAACLPHPTSVLSGIDPHCPVVSAPVPTSAALARTGFVFCHVHGLLQSHFQATQRAVLDLGYRVAVLFAFALAGAGHALGGVAGQAELSSAYNDLVASGVDCLGSLLSLLRRLLSTTSIGDSTGSSFCTECFTVLYLWGEWQIP